MRLKKSLVVFLVVLMAFSNALFAGAAFNSVDSSSSTDFVSKSSKLLNRESLSVEETSTFDANEKVRVIVELEGQTPVEYATERNVLYKELSESTKSSLEAKVVEQQHAVQQEMASEQINFDVINTFTTIANGFSGEVNFGDIERLQQLTGVKTVHLSNEYTLPTPAPDMDTSHGFIQSALTWADAGYKGEGTIIAIVDSGVDPSHQDFILSDINAHAGYLTEEEVNAFINDSTNEIKGQFFTNKVPFGFNYYDKNNEIMDLNPATGMHGQHVAGTAAANGSAHGGLDGVAPEAQILAMKVFGNDPNLATTWTDIYVKAIDDAIKLGADVVNMSLGSTAAFLREDALDNTTITRAVENGIVVAVSAGNSGHIGYGYTNPLAKNPDIGVVGSPGLSTDSLQVAATGNVLFLYETPYTVTTGTTTESGKGFGVDHWTEILGTNTFDLVTLGGGLGVPADYEGVDVAGKVVLVKRGGYSFFDKTEWAAEQGAIGIIVYNHDDSVFFHKNQGGWSIPFMKISNVEGTALEALFDETTTSLTLTVSNDAAEGFVGNEGPEMGKMTGFTSWGTTPSLELKPEISAPGGAINSTLNNNLYGVKSGTSMAAPHVAGGSALIIQYLKEEFPTLTSEERSRFAKVLLMNTADTIEDAYGQPFSPRRQGAGMMQTFNAVNTPVSVVNTLTNEAKVELKDFTTTTFNFDLTATNHSTADVTYTVDASVLADAIQTSSGVEYNSLIAGNMEGAVVTVDGGNTVTVPAGSSVNISVTVDISNATLPTVSFANGQATFGQTDLRSDVFVEGFVTLTETVAEGSNADPKVLTVPYVGFYGEWDNPSILDGDPQKNESIYYRISSGNWSRFLDQDNRYFMLPNPSGQYAISPANQDGRNDAINPLPTFLRNAGEVQFSILDETGKKVRALKTEDLVRKNFRNGGSGRMFSLVGGRSWDGTAKFAPVAEGLYTYEIKAVIGYNGAEWQTYQWPVWVDNTAPALDVAHDEATNTLNWSVVEAGSGVLGYHVYVNETRVTETLLPGTATSYPLSADLKDSFVTVVAFDYAYNGSQDTVVVGDEDVPVISIVSPGAWQAFNTLDVPVYGYVADGTGITEVKVNGEVVPVQYDAEFDDYYFETIVSYEQDGVYEAFVEATDASGNNLSLSRLHFVDTTAATITLNNEVPAYVGPEVNTFSLDVQLDDNYRQMEFYVDDNYAYGISLDYPLAMDYHTHNYTQTLDLVEGLNTFYLTLIDLGGNVTTEIVNIYKLAEGEEVPTTTITDLAVMNSEYVSTNRPATITAYSSEAINWEVTVTSPSGEETLLTANNSPNFNADFVPAENAENGEYTVTATGTNAAGQEVAVVGPETFTVYNFSTLIKSVKVLNSAGEEASSFGQNGVVNIKASVQNLEQFNVSPMVIIQVLDKDNRVAGKAFLTMDVLYAQGSNGLGMELPLKGLKAGEYKVEVFVWTGWDMIAMAEANKNNVTFTVVEALQ